MRNIDTAAHSTIRLLDHVARRQFTCDACNQKARKIISQEQAERAAEQREKQRWRTNQSVRRGRKRGRASPLHAITPSRRVTRSQKSMPRNGRSQSSQIQAIKFAAIDQVHITTQFEHVWVTALNNGRCQQPDCDGEQNVIQRLVWGHITTFLAQCKQCLNLHAHQMVGQRVQLDVGKGVTFAAKDVHFYLKSMMTGTTFTQVSVFDSESPSESSYYNIQSTLTPVLLDLIEKKFEDFRVQCRESCEANNEKLVLCINGAWSHRGRKARAHSFAVREFYSQRILCNVVLFKKTVRRIFRDDRTVEKLSVIDGTYIGNSKRMEGTAFQIALDQLEKAGLFPHIEAFVCDDDSSLAQSLRLREGLGHSKNASDPGHRVRNFLKKLCTLFGQKKDFKGMAHRMGKFLMRCIKRTVAEVNPGLRDQKTIHKRVQYFKGLWEWAYTKHYIYEKCDVNCPCNQFYSNNGVVVDSSDSDADDDTFEFDGDDLVRLDSDHLFLEEGGNNTMSDDPDGHLMSDDDDDCQYDDALTILQKNDIAVKQNQSNCTSTTTSTTASSSATLPSKEYYKALTKDDLKKICRERGEKVGGNKDDLTDRLMLWDKRNLEYQQGQSQNTIEETVMGLGAAFLCQHQQFLNNVKPRIMPKKIFNMKNEKHIQMWKKVQKIMKEVETSIHSVLHGLNTCGSESINFVRLTHCPKHRFFARSYPLRSMVSACILNFGMETTYQLFCTGIGIAPQPHVLERLQATDGKKLSDHRRQISAEEQFKNKQRRAGRLMELQEERKHDQSNKRQRTQTYHSTPTIPTEPVCPYVEDQSAEYWRKLIHCKNDELRALCREKKIPQTGKKSVLVQRLVDWKVDNASQNTVDSN